MSDHPPLLTLEGVTSGVLAPWFSGENLADGDRVATPKEAAFFSDAPPLKKLIKKLAPDAFHLHGGLSIVCDTNDVRLGKDVIAQIVLDPAANEAIGSVWLNDGETKEQAAVRAGYDVAQVPQLRFIRWMTHEESAKAPLPHWDDPEPGPPKDELEPQAPAVDPVQERLDRAAKEHEAQKRYEAAIEEDRRRTINERLAHANRLFGRSIA
jgi:hypothetical protein